MFRKIFPYFFLWAIQGYAAFNLTWALPAIPLDSNPPKGDSNIRPTLAMDPLGNAAATWSRTVGHGAAEDIWASFYHHAARVWTGPILISGGGSASNSVAAMDGLGNAIFVWEEGFPTQILSRTLSAGGVWTPPLASPPAIVNTSVGAQSEAQLAVDAAGNAIAIWKEVSKGVQHLFSARKALNAPWQGLGLLSSGATAVSLSPKALALNPAGEGIAVWQEKAEVCGAQYKEGKWEALKICSRQENLEPPSVGIDRAGNAVIAWAQNHAIYSKTVIGGMLSPERLLVSDPSFLAQCPCVGVDDAGNAVVIFERYDVAATTGEMTHKFVSSATLPFQAGSWTQPIDISGPSHPSARAGCPVLSVNAIGDGVAIWKEYDGKNLSIQGAGFSLGTWSLIRTLSQVGENATFSSCDITVALNPAGNILAIWPEDTTGTIKAASGMGLAIATLPPPRHVVATKPSHVGVVSGIQVLHRFPVHGDLINILAWSPVHPASYYKIYRGNLSTLIGTSTQSYFEDHQRTVGETVTYLITAMDSYENESGPLTIIIKPLEGI